MESALCDFYRGAVYPVDSESDSADIYDIRNKNIIKPLVNLCASYIVLDSSMTQIAIQTIPHELKIVLMQEALLGSRDRIFSILMYGWPTSNLSLKSLVPNFLSSVHLLYNTNYLMHWIHRGMLWSTCLVNAFVDGMKNEKLGNLRYLDLSGYPTSEVIISYLAVSCLLNYSANMTADLSSAFTNAQLPVADQCPEIQIPDNIFAVRLDALLMSEQSLQELVKAMVVMSDSHCKLRLYLDKLGVTCTGAPKIAVLLREIDHQQLKGLCLKFNSLTCQDLINLAPSIKNMTNLTDIDLSCNNISFYQSDATCDLMAEVFQSLPHLGRLDLSNNRIKTKLRRLLAGIPQSLIRLRLAACGLTMSDITYLSLSHHRECLKELDLSENGLGHACRNFVQLLSSISNTVQVLEIEDSFLTDEHMHSIQQVMISMKSLLYLNVADNDFSLDTQKGLTSVMANIQPLQVFRLSYASDCYLFETDDEEVNAQLLNKQELEKLAIKKSSQHCKIKIEFVELSRRL